MIYMFKTLEMFVLNIFLVLFYATSINGLQKIICSIGDEVCMKKAAQRFSVDIITGVPSGPTSDPLYLDDIEINLSTINYALHNATLNGMKDCIVTGAVISEEYLNYTYRLECPYLTTEAEYEANGTLDGMTMEGVGTLKATHENYSIIYIGNYILRLDENEKQHFQLTDFTLKLEANGNVTYAYDNLFGGDVEKSEEFKEHFSKDNWKILDQILGEATMSAFQDQYMKNCNEYMNLYDVEHIFYYYE